MIYVRDQTTRLATQTDTRVEPRLGRCMSEPGHRRPTLKVLGSRARVRSWRAVLCAGLVASVGLAARVSAFQPQGQLANPVYVDDPPAAVDGLIRARELFAGGNPDQAVRVLQEQLRDYADRVVARPTEPDVFMSVRDRVHDLLLEDQSLLGRYRTLVGPSAEGLLASGAWATLERSYLLTTPGLEAALRIAEQELFDARFESARLTLAGIERHPDLIEPPAAKRDDEQGPARLRAMHAQLWRQLSRYIHRPEIEDRAARLASDAALGNVPRVDWPPAALRRSASPLSPQPPMTIDGLVAKPLWTVPLIDRARDADALEQAPSRAPLWTPQGAGQAIPLPRFAQKLGVLPMVVGDLAVIADGASISAWDRFSLSPRWSVTPGGELARRSGSDPRPRGRMQVVPMMNFDSVDVASASGGIVVASTGRGLRIPGDPREGNDRLSAVHAESGRVLWTTTLEGLDPALSDAEVRGPVVISQGVVVVAVRRVTQERRQIVLNMLGLDLSTGSLKWQRSVASAGILPWVATPTDAEGMLEAEGIVYRMDRLGAAAAIEAASGRVRWIRKLPVEPRMMTAGAAAGWQLSVPVLDETRIITLTPDSRRVIALDRASGAVVASRAGELFGDPIPRYLLRAGDRLLSIDDDTVRDVDIKAFDSGVISRIHQVPVPGIRGRVSVVGDRVLIPSVGGVTLAPSAAAAASPASPGTDTRFVALDETGNPLVLDSQILVADDARLHSYLLWETAEKILTARMRDNPSSGAPAVTLAELAFRAGRLDRIAGAMQDAVRATLAATSDDVAATRRRLFDLAQTMALTGLEERGSDAGVPAPGALPSATAAKTIIRDRAVLSQLVEAMGQLAKSPDEQLGYALASGRLIEPTDPKKAAETYQQVLLSSDLAQATWRGPTTSVRGELEATRRLESLIAVNGAGVYSSIEAQAAEALQALGAQATIEQLETVIARFPLASHTPSLWNRVALMHQAARALPMAQRATEQGLRAALRTGTADPALVGLMAGRLISDLRARGQFAAASSVLRSVSLKFPSAPIMLVREGAAVTAADTAALTSELAARVAASQRWPRVGAPSLDEIQALPGVQLLRPLLREPTPSYAGALAMMSDDDIGLWAVGPDSGKLERAWSEKLDDRSIELIALSGDGATLIFIGEETSELVRVTRGAATDIGPGVWRVRWRTMIDDSVFPPDATRGLRRVPGGQVDQWQTPTGDWVSPSDLLVAMDERTLVLMQRSGQASGIDADTGDLLWTSATPVHQVADADVGGGALVIVGEEVLLGPRGQPVEIRPAAQVIDARSGNVIQRLSDIRGRPHWVRVSNDGACVLAADQALAAVDLATGRTNWSIADAELVPARAGWLVGESLVVLSPKRRLGLIEFSTGQLREVALQTPPGFLDQAQSVDVHPASGSTKDAAGDFIVLTPGGVASFSGTGRLIGADGLGGSTLLLPARPADDRLVSIETISDGRPAGLDNFIGRVVPPAGAEPDADGIAPGADRMLFFSVLNMDPRSAAVTDRRTLLLGARPSDLALIDGRIAITAGLSTIVLSAPVTGSEAKP
jgi:outer membrane protein assembly factor BamB